MADSLNTPILSELHQALSRRALMRRMTAAGMLAAVPVAAVAAPVPSPRERLAMLIDEFKRLAQELNPDIVDWRIVVEDRQQGGKYASRCSVAILAFEANESGSDRAGRERSDSARTMAHAAIA